MKVYLYSGTHWDREWFKSFQGFRYDLVHMMNDLLDGLDAHPEFRTFHLDGQTVVLGDYLEIMPERREQLTRLIREGRLRIGPWYCMPDEFLLSGESLIRNLQLGMHIARDEFGVEPPKCGYVCDIFGHAAQTPQIFNRLGLTHAVVGRGTNEHTTAMHFRWQALDGTEVITFKLSDQDGYGDFSAFANTHPADGDIHSLADALRECYADELARANVPAVFLFDAVDFRPLRKDTSVYLEALRIAFPDAEIIHGDLDEMQAEVDKYASSLPVKHGELNETARSKCNYLHLITNTLSSRYPIKRSNDRMQTRLEKWMSPLYAFGLTKDPIGFLNKAYKYLIQNHPHDSICGCSIDQIYRDMSHRFQQTDMISAAVVRTFQTSLEKGDGQYKLLRIANPLPYTQTRTFTVKLQFEKDYPYYMEPFHAEPIHAFKLFDAAGNEIPYGISDMRLGQSRDEYTLALHTALVPMSVTELLVVPSDRPTRYPSRLPGGATAAEGDFVRVEVNPNGSIRLTDLETGEVYPELLQLIDDGEIGDGWFHACPVNDRVAVSSAAFIEKQESNSVRTVLRITQQMRVPAKTSIDHGYRRVADDWVLLEAEHEITVSRHDRAVCVRTIVHNNAKDHRLRLRLNTNVKGDSYYSNEAFCFVRRACGDQPETADWREYGCAEKATSGVFFKCENERRGLAFISSYGLHECAVYPDGTMDVTLLRATNHTINTEGEPDGELQEDLEYRYALLPITGPDEHFAALQRMQDALSADVMSVTAKGDHAQAGAPICEIRNDSFVYSTASRLDAQTSEVRIVNFSDQTQTGTIVLPDGTTSAALTQIDGRLIRELPLDGRCASLKLGKWEIATLRFTH